MAHDLYVCYSNHDKSTADAVCATLEASELTCWIAPRDVSPGAPWNESILDAIGKSRAVVLIFSAHANKSDHVRREILRIAQLGLPLIALRTDDSVPTDIFAYIGSAAARWIDATRPPLEQHFRQLLDDTRTLLAGTPSLAAAQPEQPMAAGNTDHYDAFISYRREGGSSDARNICLGLLRNNVRAFLDVDDLRSGHFDEALLRQIEEAPNFIVILSPHSLDRCADERDWLRWEIAHAIKTDRNIVPVMVPGFRFPDAESLPEDIRALQTHNAVDYSHDYFGPMITRILSFLRTGTTATKDKPQTKSKSESSGVVGGLTYTRLVAAPDSLVGQKIGRYAIKEFIGAGGSGLVYRASRTALGQEVCIKIFYPLNAEAGDAANVIQRAARALAAMNHPNLIKVFDLETLELDDASSFYLIMEFVRGRQLDEWSLKLAEPETTLSMRLLSTRLKMALDITRALGAAHTCRYIDEVGFEQTAILHGDIKPANIIVRDDNTPVVLDFMMLDIQRLIDRGFVPPSPQGGQCEPITAAYGTPGFMAPEQDRDGIVTVKSDVFSLGVTLAHLFAPDSDNPLIGLFSSEQDKRLNRVRSLVRSMLAEDPGERPRDMEEVAGQLTECSEALAASTATAVTADLPQFTEPEAKEPIARQSAAPSALAPTVSVISPAGGEKWQAGTTQQIKWTASSGSASITKIRIELHQNEMNVLNITAPPSHLPGVSTFFRWKIPAKVTPTDEYRIKVIAEDKVGREGYATSNAGFSITEISEADKQLVRRGKIGGVIGGVMYGGLAAVVGTSEFGSPQGGVKSPVDLIIIIAIGVFMGALDGLMIMTSRLGRLLGLTGILLGSILGAAWGGAEGFLMMGVLFGLFGSLVGAALEVQKKRNQQTGKT